MNRPLSEVLAALGVGSNVGATAKAIIALCRSLAEQPDLSPHTGGAVALITDAARLLPSLQVAGSCGRIFENDYGRAIGAARLVLLARASVTNDRITIGLTVMQAAVVGVIHQAVETFERMERTPFASADTRLQMRAASYAADELCGYFGIRPVEADLLPAMSKVHDDWQWQRERTRRTSLRKKSDPTRKSAVFFALLNKLGLKVQSIAALEKCVTRASAERCAANLSFAPPCFRPGQE